MFHFLKREVLELESVLGQCQWWWDQCHKCSGKNKTFEYAMIIAMMHGWEILQKPEVSVVKSNLALRPICQLFSNYIVYYKLCNVLIKTTQGLL
jgi:hypothetical protein